MSDGRRRTLAVVLLMPVLLTGCASAASPTTTRPRTSMLHVQTRRSPRERTAELAQNLLAQVQLPAGARSRSSAPLRELRQPATSTSSSNLVDRRTWWVAPDSVSRVLRHIRRHAPQGCRFDESGSSSGPGWPTTYDVFCSARPSAYATDVTVAVEAVAIGHGSAVRADAQAVWIPLRPAYSQVVHPSDAHIVVERHASFGRRGLPTVRRTVGAAAAGRIAAAVGRLGVAPPVVTSCPADFPGDDDVVRFATSHGPVSVAVSLSGCPGVKVTVPGHANTYLAGTGTVDAVVRHVLHLARSYG